MPKLADRIKRRVAVEDHSEGEDDNISISEKALASEEEEEDDLDENSSEEDEEDEEDDEEDNNDEDIEKPSKEENKDTEDQEQKQQQQQEYEEGRHSNNVTADTATTDAEATDNPRVPKATGKVRTVVRGKNRIGTWRSDMDGLQNGIAKVKISEINKDNLEKELSIPPLSTNQPNILSRPHSAPPNRPNTRTPSKSSFQRQIEERREYQRLLKEDPSFVPYVGEFWGHDDRFRTDGLKNSSNFRGRRAFFKRGSGRDATTAVRSNGFTERAPATTASVSGGTTEDFLDKPSETHEDALHGPEMTKHNGRWQHDLFAGLMEQERKRRKEPDRPRREREHFMNPRGRGRGGPARNRGGGYVNSRRGRHFNFTERPPTSTSTFTTNTIDSPKVDIEISGNIAETGPSEPMPQRKTDDPKSVTSQSPNLSPKSQVATETKIFSTEAEEDELASQASTHNAETGEISREVGDDDNNESDIEIVLNSAPSQEQLLDQDAVDSSSTPISSSAGSLANNKDFSKFADANVPVFVPSRPHKNHSEQFHSRTNRPKSTGTGRVTIRPPPDYQGPENPYATPASNSDTSVPLYARSFQPTVPPVNASVVPPPDPQHYSPSHMYYGAQAQGTTIMPATFEANGMMYYGYDPSQMFYYYPPVSVAPMINGAGTPMMPMFVPVANGDMNGYSYPMQQSDVTGESSELTNNPHRFSAPPYYYPVYQ